MVKFSSTVRNAMIDSISETFEHQHQQEEARQAIADALTDPEFCAWLEGSPRDTSRPGGWIFRVRVRP